jgi:hypothetical protein
MYLTSSFLIRSTVLLSFLYFLPAEINSNTTGEIRRVKFFICYSYKSFMVLVDRVTQLRDCDSIQQFTSELNKILVNNVFFFFFAKNKTYRLCLFDSRDSISLLISFDQCGCIFLFCLEFLNSFKTVSYSCYFRV